ncbi:MAG: magnesium transporter CorA family protein [Sphaerochaeta sp.]|jgi:magnesium transporter|nr:magnesium transporter CorA family protein [Sphaerochaeta sp.]PKL27683.1 MAG: magnesium transporter CorA [Spirochaetae bacterium HGW-Spirochaetae-2]
MITIRNDIASRIPGDNTSSGGYTWIDAREITRDDITELQENYAISSELLADIMDLDEQARIEKEDDYVVLIVRLPAFADDSHGINQYCVPLGIVMMKDTIITICQSDSVILEDFARNRFRQYPVQTQEGFVISLMGRAAMVFIRLLKYLNRQKNLIEEELHKSVRNDELIQLLSIQKSLVYFTTSLTTNEILLEKLQKSPYFRVNTDEEREFLEDIIIDNKQAIEMSNIYSSILTGTMDAFASVISNNLSIIMRRLTVISIAFMFPTFLVGYYGMNLKLPFEGNPFMMYWIIGLSLLAGFGSTYILSDKRSRKRAERHLESARKRREKQRRTNRRKGRVRED